MTYSANTADPTMLTAPETAEDVLARLVTYFEIDTARVTLQRLVDLRTAEHELDASSRLDASGGIAANRALLDALDQLTVVRKFRAVPDELVQAYRERARGGQQT